MRQNACKYLGVTRFSSLGNWSVGHLLKKNIGFTDKYPVVAIGQIITRSLIPIEIKDDILYKQVTLKTNGGGAVLRGEKIGKEIGTKKQFIVFKGQFIMSKIDARNGAFGIISEKLDGAVVTADFPVFDVDASKVLPEYLERIASTKKFAKFAQSCSRGTTNRQRIDVELFLSQEIPLPSLAEQKSIVKAYYDKIHDAEMLEEQAKRTEEEIDRYLLSELGLAPSYKQDEPNVVSEPKRKYEAVNKIHKNKYLHFIKFKEVERWDVLFLSQTSVNSGKYDNFSMKECINFFMKDPFGKSLRKETFKKPNEKFLYIGMENIEKNTGQLIEEKEVKGGAIKSQTIAIPPKYFIYGKLRPYLNKYWYNETSKDNIVCSSEFFVFSIKSSINPYYFKYFISSSYVQRQIEKTFRGARMPRINEDTFKSIKVSIPPISIQDAIVDCINKKKHAIEQQRNQAVIFRKEAVEFFKKEIFFE